MKRVAVVGGGITGLAAGWRLQRLAEAAGRRLEVIVLEASARPGGKILTETLGEALIEGGPDSFITIKPQALDLARELGLGERLVPTSRENTDVHVYAAGRLRRMPLMLMAPARVLPFLSSDLFSWRGKLRMGLDLILPRGRAEDESIGSFVRRRLGPEALDRVAQPVLGGIYAGDADSLSLKATFPRFQEIESRYRSIIVGLRAAAAARGAARREDGVTMFMTLAGGLGELVDALASRLGPALRAGWRVLRVRPGKGLWRLEVEGRAAETADAVILTAPAWRSADQLEAADPELARGLRAIPFASSATASLLYGGDAALPPGFGFVVARAEQGVVTAGTFTSNKFPGRVAAGTSLVRCFVGGAGRESALRLADTELLEEALADLRRLVGLRAAPLASRIYRWERANPQYTVGHEDRLARIEERRARWPGLFLAGASYRGVGIPDCIKDGNDTAAAAFAAA